MKGKGGDVDLNHRVMAEYSFLLKESSFDGHFWTLTFAFSSLTTFGNTSQVAIDFLGI